MLDLNRINQLKDEIGAEDFKEVAELFLDETDSAVDALRSNAAAASEHTFHSLKGSALNLGLSDFASICADYESMAKQGQSPSYDIDALLACYDQSKSAFIGQALGG